MYPKKHYRDAKLIWTFADNPKVTGAQASGSTGGLADDIRAIIARPQDFEEF